MSEYFFILGYNSSDGEEIRLWEVESENVWKEYEEEIADNYDIPILIKNTAKNREMIKLLLSKMEKD